jgi:hypothetical protein
MNVDGDNGVPTVVDFAWERIADASILAGVHP